MTRKLLVIDDDAASCRLMNAIFSREGFAVSIAHDGISGLERVPTEQPDVVVLDLRLPGMDGIDVLNRIRATQPSLPVVILTAHGELKTAIRATQLGAFDYLTKPIDHDELVLVIKRAVETRELRMEVELLRQRLDDGGALATQMGPSAEARDVIDQVRTVAASNFTVLITGETGTGKELVAQAIHRLSDRTKRPFIALDCAALPETLLDSELLGHEKGASTGTERKKAGHLQLAEGGSLFLDEVGNMPMHQQAKLLRALESKRVQPVGAERTTPINVRFIAATNHDLQARVGEREFRADLYFRLAQYTIVVPPLRSRVADIPYLAGRFLEEVSIELRRPVQEIAPDALELLQTHAWPGNVRELRNTIRHAVLETEGLVIASDVLQPLLRRSTAPHTATPALASDKSLREIASQAAREAERHAISETLRTTHGNKARAAKLLRTDYKTLHLKMKHLGLRGRDFAL